MTSVSPLERTLTELDHVRLQRLTRSLDAARQHPIDELLDSVTLVPSRAVSPDVVTMYSQLLLLDLDSLERRKITLCYPADAEPAQGFVSVLSPIGLGLLGLRVGAIAAWHAPDGQLHRAEIVALLFQPEASGDYVT